MVLHISPYSSACLHFLDGLSWSLVFPCYWLLDRLLASCVATSLEKHQRSQDPCSFLSLCILISAPLYLVLLLTSLPFALLGFVIWAPLQAVRQPYLYTYRRPDKHHAEQGQAGPGLGTGEWRPQGRSFSFCSANVCLLPDSLARFNNLSDTHRRAREVGKRIRNGASRPQIKIYIDSPTNTSISAASFSSLATGFCRTSLDQRPTNGPIETDNEPHVECPIHVSGASECPVHPNTGDLGETWECPVHSAGGQNTRSHQDCPMHEGSQTKPSHDCPLHTSGVQISISAPEPEPQDEEVETSNHQLGEQAGGDAGSMAASRESLARYHGSDGGTGTASNNTLSHVTRTSIFKRPGRKRRHADETFDHEISAFFPANLDFLALQEVFDHGATRRLHQQLHRYFPYVLSDVGRYGWKGWCSSFKFLNSGLMLASRYPILDARYDCYPNGRGEDALAAKGALFAKVHVGTSHQDQRVVGYLTCTHLHAIEGDASIRCEQLDLLLQWGAEFHLVAFDVVLGDLNFDNCSSGMEVISSLRYGPHVAWGPGEDKPWALGNDTLANSLELWRVMENEEGRKEYLAFPPSKSQCPASSQKGRKIPLKATAGGLTTSCTGTRAADIEDYSFVTQLAGLTDHLSVAMRLAVSAGEEEP
uniref:sphingomyelin phosphodiesterase n=1 Tax=Takifugu rubripes TaxID=31033 RepID=A0A3B5K0U3_TAKRU